MYIYIHVHIYMCRYIYTFQYTSTTTYMYMYMYMYVYVYTHIHMYIYMYTCTYIYLYMHTHIYIYVYIYNCVSQPKYSTLRISKMKLSTCVQQIFFFENSSAVHIGIRILVRKSTISVVVRLVFQRDSWSNSFSGQFSSSLRLAAAASRNF